MKLSTTFKSTTLALLLVLGMFASSADAKCPTYKRSTDHDMDKDYDWDMDKDHDMDKDWDMDKDYDRDMDYDMDKDHDDWDMDKDWDMDRDHDDWDHDKDWDADRDYDMDKDDWDFDDCDDVDSDDSFYGLPDSADEDDFPVHPPEFCTADNQCVDRRRPFCLDSFEDDGKKTCQPCFELEDAPAKTKCTALFPKKPVCTRQGFCGADLSNQKNLAGELKGKKLPPQELANEMNALLADAFVDDFASDDSMGIMADLMVAFDENVDGIDDEEGFTTFLGSMKEVTGKADHFNAEGAKSAVGTVGKLLGKAKGFGKRLEGDNAKNLFDSIGNSAKGARVAITDASEKKTQLRELDATVRDFAKLAMKDAPIGDVVELVNDEIKASFKRVKQDKLAEEDCAAGTTGCVDFPTAISDAVSGCSGNSAVDIENLQKTYNANEENTGAEIASGSTEINLNCVNLDDGSTAGIKVENLPENIKFTLTLDKDKEADPKMCRFWDEEAKAWNSEGCTGVVSADKTSVECSCNHLTEFAAAYVSSTNNGDGNGNGNGSGGEGDETDKPTESTSSGSSLFIMPIVVIIGFFTV